MNKNLLKALGPGILFASTAIGVSHLVQSTRAGAVYGMGLLWAVILANVAKYPFFEFGSRYASATGESLIDGYERMGRWVSIAYLLVTLASMFFVSAAVTAVTAGFMDNLFGLGERFGFGPSLIAMALLLLCGAILSIGRYRTLDGLIKLIGSVLLLTTLTAFVLTLIHGPLSPELSWTPELDLDTADLAFLIALMGWMPTAVDLSTWNSLWTVERMEQTGYRPALKETLFDFNLGYLISALLAICFLMMGGYLIYGSGEVLPAKGAAFAHRLIEMYTETLGDWSYLVIASAGFAIMFGTCIAVLDGYGRAMSRSLDVLMPGSPLAKSNRSYPLLIWVTIIGTLGIVVFRGAAIKELVDLATTISFLIAPFVAIANLRLVSGKYVDDAFIPPMWLKALAYFGIVFLLAFSIYFMLS